MRKIRMSKVAVLLSTGQLGGAERSLIEQLATLNDKSEILFFTPTLGRSKHNLDEMLNRKGFSSSQDVLYPKFIYEISRKQVFLNLIFFIKLPLLFFYSMYYFFKFKSFTIVYVNGIKASVPFFLMGPLVLRKIHVLWHFRDYPHPAMFKCMPSIFSFYSKFKTNVKFSMIGNSESVTKELNSFLTIDRATTLYNLPGDLPEKKTIGKIKHIGIVSMLAPWKGLHSMLLNVALYEKELKDLGIEKITFFGDDIYMTEGSHSRYKKNLLTLNSKLGIDFVFWAGHKDPIDIYTTIDLLIHPSLKVEPFGRVIIEAQKSGIPVISTGLGGAMELISEGRGEKFFPYDYSGLFQAIKKISSEENYKNQMIKRSSLMVQKIETEITAKISHLIG